MPCLIPSLIFLLALCVLPAGVGLTKGVHSRPVQSQGTGQNDLESRTADQFNRTSKHCISTHTELINEKGKILRETLVKYIWWVPVFFIKLYFTSPMSFPMMYLYISNSVSLTSDVCYRTFITNYFKRYGSRIVFLMCFTYTLCKDMTLYSEQTSYANEIIR